MRVLAATCASALKTQSAFFKYMLYRREQAREQPKSWSCLLSRLVIPHSPRSFSRKLNQIVRFNSWRVQYDTHAILSLQKEITTATLKRDGYFETI